MFVSEISCSHLKNQKIIQNYEQIIKLQQKMGSIQVNNSSSLEQISKTMSKNNNRLMKWEQSLKFKCNGNEKLTILPFRRMADWQIQLEGIEPSSSPLSTVLVSTVYFQQQSSIDAYLANLIGLKQICLVNLYDDFELQTQKRPFSLTTTQQLTGVPKPINRNELRSNTSKFINLLVYFSQTIASLKNLYIIPEQIVQLNHQYYLRGFYHRQCDKKKLMIAYIIWLCQESDNFDDCYNFENLGSINTTNRYIREILFTIKSDKIDDQDLVGYFKNLNDKMRYLQGGFDSFHVCFRAKRQKYNTNNNKQWLLAKRNNEIFFYNIDDNHVCQGRIVRKSNKVNIENNHIIFNSSEFQVSFMLQNSKNMVKTTQFQLSDCFTVSDIEIKHKFPFKFRNPMIFCRGRELYLLDQMVYKYNIDENKIYQQSKKINDYLCLTQSSEHSYIVIRYSIDIFRHGIKVYLDNRYQALMPSGNPDLAASMENIKVDIKHVEFCQQVYKGIYFMMASRNLWILDINYMCFFSFAPLERLSHFYKGKAESKEYVFNIFSQPFKMNWLHHQFGHNIHIKEDIMHVLANVSGKIFYLQYRLIFEAGSLKLLSYRPLYQKKISPKAIVVTEAAHPLPLQKQHYFNVYNESLQMYKNTSWIHKGPVFFEVNNLKICSFKSYTQIFVVTEGVLKTLKQMIQQQTKQKKSLRPVQTVMLLYRIWNIMFYLNQNNISHKNFNLNNIWISQKKQVKLVGWSEPQRSWHISDYKDYLLTSFNLITLSSYDKLTEKIIQKHDLQMSLFPSLLQKMQMSLRNKSAQKRPEVQKSLLSIRQSLNAQVYKILMKNTSNHFIFSFENNTPRFTMLNIQQCKIKKIVAVIQGMNEFQQFTFKSTDEYAWNQQQGSLYIFTANYKMYQIKIYTIDLKQETLFLEEYEYLPSNIIDCSFIFTANNLFAFGGVSRSCKNKVQYNENVYCFNRKKLTWQAIAKLQAAKIKPKLVPSQSGNKIYIMAGDLGIGQDKLQILTFNTITLSVDRMVDLGMDNPFKALADRNIFKAFEISEQFSIYAIWSVGSINFNLKVFSTHIAGFDIDIEGKIYLQEGVQLPSISINFSNGNLHFLRPYGKYTKITFQGLQNPKIINKTLYSN